jgi:hypothetical protein
MPIIWVGCLTTREMRALCVIFLQLWQLKLKQVLKIVVTHFVNTNPESLFYQKLSIQAKYKSLMKPKVLMIRPNALFRRHEKVFFDQNSFFSEVQFVIICGKIARSCLMHLLRHWQGRREKWCLVRPLYVWRHVILSIGQSVNKVPVYNPPGMLHSATTFCITALFIMTQWHVAQR